TASGDGGNTSMPSKPSSFAVWQAAGRSSQNTNGPPRASLTRLIVTADRITVLLPHGDDRLDDAGLRPRVRREHVNHLVEGRTVRDPGAGVDLALLDQRDDLREVLRQGVARAEQRPLGAVEHRMAELHLVGGDADEDQPAAVGDQAEAVRHRAAVA